MNVFLGIGKLVVILDIVGYQYILIVDDEL